MRVLIINPPYFLETKTINNIKIIIKIIIKIVIII
jgi:hypothetical protein